MDLNREIEQFLKNREVHFVHFIDVSGLNVQQNKAYPEAVLFGIGLSPAYIQKVSVAENYVERMKQRGEIQNDEFHLSELKTDGIADELEQHIKQLGYDAYSQSEQNIESSGHYNVIDKSTPLPHKVLAGMAGLGWIGKNNLLIHSDYGAALSMCSVLTNAPLKTSKTKIMDSKCGTCVTCVNTCSCGALKGELWNISKHRDQILDVHRCTTCIECMMVCPWTQNYVNRTKV